MRRLVATFSTMTVSLLLLAPVALAQDHGQGTWGEANDKTITNAGFIVIAFFPLLILLFSMLQWQLEKRKDRRKKATKKLSAEWRGGW
jgi:hypothetical protein